MNLNHLDLTVDDVPHTVTLFETLFGLTLQSNRNSPALAILSDDAGFVLVLQRGDGATRYPEGMHFGFYVDTVDQVLATQAKARELGVKTSALIENGRGSMIYLEPGSGLTIEVNRRKTG